MQFEFYELTNDEAELLDTGEFAIGLIVNGIFKFWLFNDGRVEIASARSIMIVNGLTKRQRVELTKKDYIEDFNEEGDLNDVDALNGNAMHFADCELYEVPKLDPLDKVSDQNFFHEQWFMIDDVAKWWASQKGHDNVSTGAQPADAQVQNDANRLILTKK